MEKFDIYFGDKLLDTIEATQILPNDMNKMFYFYLSNGTANELIAMIPYDYAIIRKMAKATKTSK